MRPAEKATGREGRFLRPTSEEQAGKFAPEQEPVDEQETDRSPEEYGYS